MNAINITTAALVDQLGLLRAQIAALTEQEKQIKAQLIATGEASIDGAAYRATISITQRETLDMEAVREKLSQQFIRAHTRVTEVPCVRVHSRVRA